MNVKLLDSKVEQFISALEEETIARVLRTIDLLQVFGNQLGLPHSKKVETQIFELRIRGKQEVRIFYTFHGGNAILVHGFVKKSERIPRKEIATARNKLRALDRR